MIKCNCGKVLTLPAIYVGNGVIRYNCTCGHIKEVQLQSIPSYTAEKSGNVNLSRGEYFKYKNKKIKFSCPICKRLQFIKDPDLSVTEDKVSVNISCDNKCGFNSSVILEDCE